MVWLIDTLSHIIGNFQEFKQVTIHFSKVWLIVHNIRIKWCFSEQFFIIAKGCFHSFNNLRATELFRIWSRENIFRLRNSGQNLRWAAGGRLRRRWGRGRRHSGWWGRRRAGTQGIPLQAGVADPDPGILFRIWALRIPMFETQNFSPVQRYLLRFLSNNDKMWRNIL